MRSRIQSSWLHLVVAACAACSVGVVACSDSDPETGIDPLQGAGGNAGSASSNAGAAGSAGSGGAPSGGGQGGSSGGAAAGSSAGGAAAGSSAGGSANAGAGGAAGAAGAAGSGPDVGDEPDAGGLDPDEPDPNEEDPGEAGLSFAEDVLPIFAANCGTCHTTQRFAGHSVGGALPQSYDDALRLGMTLLQRIDGGGMPPACGDEGEPGDPGCLTVQQVETVRTWIADGSQP